MAATRSIADDLGDRGVQIAIALVACITVLATMGAIHVMTGSPRAFDVHRELHLERGLVRGMSLPALFSGAVLYAAAGLSLVIAAGTGRRAWTLLGAFFAVFFAFAGTDELIQIHENFDSSAVDWQVVYLPILGVAGACWLRALRRMREFESEWLLWLGGAAAWIVAQTLEFTVNRGWMDWTSFVAVIAFVEEIFEMAGSSMFLLALYLVSRRTAAARRP